MLRQAVIKVEELKAGHWGLLPSLAPSDVNPQKSHHPELNSKICLWQGDMTRLEIDGIVNAANSQLAAGGGICGAIHRAAGPELAEECATLGGCSTGKAKITQGYKLPAKHVLHAVGPIGESPRALQSCYQSVLDLCVEHGLRTICFCCISTGIYGYPSENAANIALDTVRTWLEEDTNVEKIDLIVFCAFEDKDKEIYERLLPLYFPPEPSESSEAEQKEN
eukprot:CAMPEP_0113935190 /NCGR_PEP_ID=MMETSP1339-20121228/2395_1 /TAXON_ID=94617 /ORGANISM="Fibrocapsa japonica" /LENGTH=221 /DNA_ID=CAMNT_0000937257 /DNA_START=51 /DNA_END=716 /DNA_ORIENTATION=+ /assembly_acc=CAM_ASM_000762